MKGTEINSEIKKTKTTMDLLSSCMNDKKLNRSERMSYYRDYLEVAKYYLLLNKSKPAHNLTIN